MVFWSGWWTEWAEAPLNMQMLGKIH
jgi:hypothetical protein